MKLHFFTFLRVLFPLLIAVFFVHIFILKLLVLPLFEHQIMLAYLMNIFLAITIYALFLKLKERLKNQLGFVFVFGSFLKFMLFFMLFYAPYKVDGEISNTEFFTFFTPYFFCLFIEVFYMARLLNKME